MRKARPEAENQYVMNRLARVLAELKEDPHLMGEFLQFAVRQGAEDPVSFSVRLSNTLKQDRPPSAFTALVMLEFAELHLGRRAKADKRR